ncbi:MAG: flagellar basal-body MS-ring/collar protein FliF [Pseudomonadota bacterium]|nr:flagellar basal-body MS-ring/collar protein FliF [Pseudomonadota bacterium]
MNNVIEFVKTLGAARLAAMGAVALGLIGFFVFLMLRLSSPQMGVLFTDLTFQDSVEITKKLEAMNVPHEVRQDGAIIMAPKERVPRLRLELAGSGLPAGGTVGYEIFDKGETLGSTSFVQNINQLRALEGELARTIRAIDRVQTARVHLVLPQRKLFSTKAAEPSASIVLKVRGSLESGQIKAIQHLIASAVEELKPGRVSIVDETGRLLANGSGDGDKGSTAAVDERSSAFERRTQQDIEEIVARVVGPGRVRARVTAELDYNKVTETSDIYDPNGQVVRSTQTREENSASASQTGDNGVSVSKELPAANADQGGGTEKDRASKSEEIVNYEISRTTKTEIAEGGRIKRLSVAVLVDGIYAQGSDGKLAYQERPAEQIEQISQLVRTAVGFDKTRGDQVHVASLQFADTAAIPGSNGEDRAWYEFSKAEYFRMAELGTVVLISLLVLLFVVRPLVRRIITPEKQPKPVEALAAPENPSSAVQAIEGPKMSSAASKALASAKIVGEVQAAAIRDIGNIVENNPEEAVTIIRNWIQEEQLRGAS